MQVHNLKMENLEFLLRALYYSLEPAFLTQLDTLLPDYFKLIEGFLPRLVDEVISKEMLRCKLSDIIMLMESFYRLWDRSSTAKGFNSLGPIKKVYTNCGMYLSEYLGQSKKDITGSEFANLVH